MSRNIQDLLENAAAALERNTGDPRSELTSHELRNVLSVLGEERIKTVSLDAPLTDLRKGFTGQGDNVCKCCGRPF